MTQRENRKSCSNVRDEEAAQIWNSTETQLKMASMREVEIVSQLAILSHIPAFPLTLFF